MSEQFEPHPGGGYYANTDFMPVDSWRILRIMSEFVESFETMSRTIWWRCSVPPGLRRILRIIRPPGRPARCWSKPATA